MTHYLPLALLLCVTFTASVQSAVLFSTNGNWKYFKGRTEASSPDPAAWRTLAFDDASWEGGVAPLYYGETFATGTILSDMQNQYSCVFLRRTFVVTNLADITGLRLDSICDDGFIAWINGVEVDRFNMPVGAVAFNGVAASAVEPTLRNPTLANPSSYLVLGTNVIAVQGFNASLGGSSDFVMDAGLFSTTPDSVAPTIVSIEPSPGTVSQFTSITITFNEPVTGLDSLDFLINGIPASLMTGDANVFTFTFPQPASGSVAISWGSSHAITDFASPANPFNATAPEATWQYTLLDGVPPAVATLIPPAGVTVRTLSQVEVTFSEPVTGVAAEDLLINGQPAASVSPETGARYVFHFAQPPIGAVQVAWAANHGITDLASAPNAFAGGAWNYHLDPNASIGDLVINEILASSASPHALADEDGEPQDWIEIHNRGSNTVNLADWSLSDDPDVPGFWTFPARSLAPGSYLVVFASAKDRKGEGSTPLHTNFRLSGSGEPLGLYSPESPRALISGFAPAYPAQRNDISYGYDSAGQLRYFPAPTPGAPNGGSPITGVVEPLHFSVARGHYTAPFHLYLTTPTRRAQIRYTTNGTEPTEENGALYTGPLRIAASTLLRAAAFRTNFLPSTVGTHSYLFNFTAAQRSLPIINIVTATNNLIGRTGIMGMNGGGRTGDGAFVTNNPATDYHNPTQHGIAWERPVSVEYIHPEDNSGFQIDAGLRIQGSDWQRPRTTALSKFSYRLYFRGDYGPGKLDYPLFPLTTVQRFDQIVLRAGFNEQVNPFIRDEITRRLSHDMGAVASHGGMALVLLNGGPYTNNAGLVPVYNTCERVNGAMLQSHLGGGSEWDVVGPAFAVSSEGLGVVDGDRTEFNSLLNYVWTLQNNTTMTHPAVYAEVGRRLDLVNFVDYCLLNAYVAMGDWPANNWRAGRERGPGGIWRFIAWDAEWAMGIYSLSVGRDSFGLAGTGTEDAGLSSTVNSEIARLHQRLLVNPEFRLLWADRIQKHFFNGGALTGANITNRFNQLRTQLAGFIPAMDVEILAWARDRRPTILGQFNTYGLYGHSNALHGTFGSSNAPAYNRHGGRVAPGFLLTMTPPLGGTTYYTTNGADPRVPFSGAVSNIAVAYTGPVPLSQTAVVKARTLLNGTNWSALSEAVFEVGTLGVPLRITEINYNPVGGSAYEFIELKNVSAAPVDLSGMTFEGVSFTFLHGEVLAGGAVLVLASNADTNAFAVRYPGVVIAGAFGGQLSNGGERLVLKDRDGRIIVSVDYRDAGGWPAAADGFGSSLEIIDPNGDADDPANWRASAPGNGSPGVVAPIPPVAAVRLNEVMAENLSAVANGGTYPDWIELHNAGGGAVDLEGWSLSDDGNPQKFVFPAGTTLNAGGYLVVWCDSVTNTTPGLHTGFALGRNGETLSLYDSGAIRVDAVTYGLQLPDASLGRVAGDWGLNVPTPHAPNQAATTGSATNLLLNEWLASAPFGQEDWIELYNRSTTESVALQGLYVGTSNALYRIPSRSFIAPGGYVQLFADELPGPDHLDFKLPAAGGAIVLYDDTGAEIDRVTYAGQVEGVSQGRLPDGGATIVGFPASVSPGASNYTVTYAGPILNEVLARNRAAVTNGAGRVADWVELFNPGASTFDLSGMSLSLDEVQPGQWVFPANTTLPANGYLVVWCDGARDASISLGAVLNAGRSLDGESGGVYLFNPAGQLVNSIEYGFQLDDRSIGRSGSVWRLLATPSPGAANAAIAALGAVTNLLVNEWMARPASGDDWFEIYNTNSLPVDLGGLYLTDDPSLAGQSQFRVAPLSFIAGRGWVTWVADGNAGAGRNHVNFALDGAGDTLRISTTNFVAIDTVYFGAPVLGASQGRLPDGTTNVVSFPSSPTPGESNHLPPENAILNEALSHADPPLEDAIEFHNPTAAPASIGGWYLSNHRDTLKKFRVPDGTTIPAGGYIVFYESQFNNGSPTSFFLNKAHGGEAILSQADASGNLTGYRTAAKFGAAANGVSFGRFTTSVGEEFVAMAQRTFGVDNPGSVAQFRTGTGLANTQAKVGPIVLSEIMYHPLETNGTSFEEYIELHNLAASAVPFFDPVQPGNTWHLSGGVEFSFPPNVTLAGGGRLLVVSFDPAANAPALAAFRSQYGLSSTVPVYGPFRGRLGNEGESVELLKPEAPAGPPDAQPGFVPYVQVDKVDYDDQLPWPSGAAGGGGLSLQRRAPDQYGNDPINWVASAPTPGGANGGGVVAPPVITAAPQNQTAPEGVTVSFSVSAGGSEPAGFQWRHNRVNIPGATASSLTLQDIALEDTGNYDVLVSNPGGSAFSDPAALLVTSPPIVIETPQTAIVRPGTNVLFSVKVRASAPITYQWRYQESEIPGATNASLLLTNVQLAGNGDYVVRITNPIGTAEASGRLIVLVNPIFLESPQSQSVVVGDDVTFSVVVSGTLPMGFRWRFGGSPVPGFGVFPAPATITLTNVGTNQAGTYTVVATNLANLNPGVLSGAAVLTVLIDTDGDRVPDVWENANGTNPTLADGHLDPDGDGVSNREEYLAGTNPQDAQSYLRIDAFGAAPGGGTVLQFFAVSNKTYTVQSAEALNGVWSKLTDLPSARTNRTITLTNAPPAGPEQFYRLLTPRSP